MTKPNQVIVDCSTGISTIVELTAEEVAQNSKYYTHYFTVVFDDPNYETTVLNISANKNICTVLGTSNIDNPFFAKIVFE
jgi:hypothetical protein